MKLNLGLFVVVAVVWKNQTIESKLANFVNLHKLSNQIIVQNKKLEKNFDLKNVN